MKKGCPPIGSLRRMTHLEHALFKWTNISDNHAAIKVDKTDYGLYIEFFKIKKGQMELVLATPSERSRMQNRLEAFWEE